jgi:putative ABC transport system permease protein
MSSRAERTYRRFLVLLPRGFRQEAEAELLEVFRATHARIRGPRAAARFWGRILADLLVTAAAEHTSGHRLFHSPDIAPELRRHRMRMIRPLADLATDIRFAARQLVARPAWTLIASGTLALGLAASLVAGVLMRDVILRPLPFPDADRLVRLLEVSADGGRWWPAYPNARDWREHGRMFDAVGISGTPRIEPVILEGHSVQAPVAMAGAGFLEMFAVRPAGGRLFTADEHRPGGPPVALVTERFWRGPLNGQRLTEAAVTIDGTRYSVVGVLPGAFKSLNQRGVWAAAADVWTPLEQETALGHRGSHGGYHVIARLRPGITLERAGLEMNDLAATLKAQHGERTQADRVLLTPLHDVAVRAAREPLQLLQFAGLGVLLVACLNLSGAILAQGLTRARELDIRGALGATRWRLARHLLTGSATLAVPGTLIGFLAAAAGLRAVKAYAAGTWPRLDEAALDWPAVTVALVIAGVTCLIAGLLPALTLSRAAARERLRSHSGAGGAREPRLWTVFVTGQVALAFVLLVASGLLVRSFIRAAEVDLGYEPANVVAIDVRLPTGSYGDASRRLAFYQTALERLRGLPGVHSAGLTSVLPHETTAYTAGTRIDVPGAKSVMAGYRLVDRGYLETMGIPVLAGDRRALEAGAALIDRRLMHLLWNGESPIGDRVLNSFDRAPVDVAGVVGTVREWDQGDETTGAVYVPYTRQPIASMHFVLRHGAGADETIASAAREALRGLDPLVPVRIEPFESRVAAALDGRRLLLVIAAGFGGAALLLAAAGVYTMIAFAVARRRRETAIRLALGAGPATLQRAVVLQGLRPAAVGAVLGLVLTVPMGQAVRAHLFQVTTSDPLVLAGACAAILLAASAAAAAPARRSSRVDPVSALRQD